MAMKGGHLSKLNECIFTYEHFTTLWELIFSPTYHEYNTCQFYYNKCKQALALGLILLKDYLHHVNHVLHFFDGIKLFEWES